jgi:hypothetical protein
MKKVVFAVLFAAMLFGTMAIGHADRGGWRAEVRSRINAANHRIQRGAERGSLTQAEAFRLKQELGTILLKINYMKTDGHLSQRERNKINSDLDRLDRDIAREKHDDDYGRRKYDGKRTDNNGHH